MTLDKVLTLSELQVYERGLKPHVLLREPSSHKEVVICK